VGDPDWLEPEEGWYPGWVPGTIVLDKRSEHLVEIVEVKREVLFEGDYAWRDTVEGGAVYWSFRIRYVDDGTDPANGVWRAPEDLEPLNAMEVLAHARKQALRPPLAGAIHWDPRKSFPMCSVVPTRPCLAV